MCEDLWNEEKEVISLEERDKNVGMEVQITMLKDVQRSPTRKEGI